MHWNLSFEPEVMKVLPDCDLLLNKLSPMLWKLLKIKVRNGEVMRTRAHHVKKGGYTVEGASDEQNAPFRSKLRLPVPLRVVCLDDPDAFVDKPFASQAHVHQCLVKLLCNVTVRAADQSCDFLQISS